MTTAGMQLQAWRKERGQSRSGLAQAIGIAPGTVPHLEQSALTPSYALAERIRAATGIPIEAWGKLSSRRKKPAARQQQTTVLKSHRLCELCSSKPRACQDQSCVVFAIRLEAR